MLDADDHREFATKMLNQGPLLTTLGYEHAERTKEENAERCRAEVGTA